jgi:hypothetical protein
MHLVVCLKVDLTFISETTCMGFNESVFKSNYYLFGLPSSLAYEMSCDRHEIVIVKDIYSPSTGILEAHLTEPSDSRTNNPGRNNKSFFLHLFSLPNFDSTIRVIQVSKIHH